LSPEIRAEIVHNLPPDRRRIAGQFLSRFFCELPAKLPAKSPEKPAQKVSDIFPKVLSLLELCFKKVQKYFWRAGPKKNPARTSLRPRPPARAHAPARTPARTRTHARSPPG